MSLIAFFLCLIWLSSCAMHHEPSDFMPYYGFFSGLLHGLLCPLAICINIISWLFSIFDVSIFSNIEIIGRPNTGFSYNAGFTIGLIIILDKL